MAEEMTPNPGSDEAMDLGCTCAVLDNCHGRGFPWGPDGKTEFWVTVTCPLHGSPEKVEE